MTSPEMLDLSSMNIAETNRAKLKALFPSVFTETYNKNGELIESIDFEKLKAELGTFSDIFDSRKERYGMEWPGKKEALRLIQQPSYATLKPCREESVNFDTTENLFIEGDNLEVLKLLQKSYYGKVKMIYIDPPYNTGKEFIYPDDYKDSLENYLAYAGLVDDEGRKFSTNTANEGRFHTKWLNMIYPRLYLARNLLREDGVIFISIDDNEVSNLRKLCDEIFGEEKFIGCFIWKSRQNKDNRSKNGASIDHEYILSYGNGIRGDKRDITQYTNPDNDPRGLWNSGNMVGLATAERRPNLHYDLINPDTKINYGCPSMGWRYDKKTMEKLIKENYILWPLSPDGRPRKKTFLNELSSEYTGFSSVIGNNIYTRDGTNEIDQLFESRIMDFPKPVNLVKALLKQGLNKHDITLDFFSGSSTTAHAVLDLNKEDGGNRRFIMVQLPEHCEENSEAKKAGYDTIADIGKERIRRVIQKIQSELDQKEQENQTLLPDLRDEIPQLDLGFKVLKLNASNFNTWQGYDPEIEEGELIKQLELHINHIKPTATQEDILYELLLKSGFMPTEKVENLTLADKTVYSISEGALLICLEDEITRELIDAIAEEEPLQFICLDQAFQGNDQLKANAVQTFESHNKGKESHQQILFRTV